MKNIFKIHPFYYITALICFVTGYFRFFITVSILIIIHEIGHILGMIYYKWNIKKIILLPFGGITICEEIINRPLIEEFIITILGPLFQFVFALILRKENVTNISNMLLFFNLLPIIPLDGSKLLNIFLNKIFSFKNSYNLTIFISVITILITIKMNIILLLIFIFLIKEIINNYKNKNYIFNKFLLERYYNDLKFKKLKIIDNIKKMKRSFRHIFYINNKYYTEKEILKKIYKNY